MTQSSNRPDAQLIPIRRGVDLPRRARDPRIDAFRGLALIMIIIDHMPGNPWEHLTIRNIGFSDAAEAFFIMSGIAAGIACLWGPAHGGANQAALESLKEIGTPDRIPEFIARAKDKDDPFRLMGFGHRVYKNFDPRATVMKESADEVLDLLGIENNPILAVAKELEKQALDDPYFVDRKLFPNVDFYSGIILEAMAVSYTHLTLPTICSV